MGFVYARRLLSKAPAAGLEHRAAAGAGGAAPPGRHALLGSRALHGGAPNNGWNEVDNSISYVSQLLPLLQGARAAPRRGADSRPLGAQVRRGDSAQKLDWLVVEEITQLNMALGGPAWG